MTGVALAALIAAAPAGAQTQTEPVESQEMQATTPMPCPEGATETATGEPCPADSSAAAPMDEPSEDATVIAPTDAPDTMTGSLPSTDETDAAESEAMQSESTDMVAEQKRDTFITEQADDTVLASELIGRTVYNPADEALGDVNDVAWKEDGSVDAVIVGVGGFLGIGEKAVGVAYEAIEVTTDENGDRKLVLSATEDELAAAPEFMTTEEKMAAIEAEQAAQQAPATGATPVVPEPAPAE
jgi:hypothetical protein